MIERELELARRSLLDLTLRNRLLNYRPSAQRSIRVIGELPAEIYDALVLREKALEFRAMRRGASEAADAWTSSTLVEARHTDRWLQTPHDDETLAKKLFRVYHEGRSAVEEQGYTVAHLAIGFLEWFESEESTQPRRAPLILVPAELERVRAGDFSKVKWTGEDVFANISLQAKLVEHGVALPPFEAPEEKGGIDRWLESVVSAIARKPRWRVLSELTLDFFSFTKFVMFKDLDPATWPEETRPHDHPLLQTLFRPEGASDARAFDETHIDETLTARDLFHVMDADPSQIAVIEDVKAGRNLVVQGPPGTGKSQTITNLIAEQLAAGKTVLFVSEKMAALEVVKSRLDAAGLGPFCLELHSRKANKKAVLLELQRALGTKPLPAVPEQALDEHELLKRELNRYARDLGTPVGKLPYTPYQLFSMLQIAPAALLLPNAESIAPADVVAAETVLRELADLLPLVQPVAQHPWRASTRSLMLPHEEEELRALLARAFDALRAADEAAASLAQTAGVQAPRKLRDFARATQAAEVIARAGAPTEAAILLSSEWNAANPAAEELVRRVEAFQRDRAELARTFREEALEGNSAPELDEFAALAVKFLRVLNGRYRALRKQLAASYVHDAPKPAQMVADFSRLVEHQSVRDALRGDPRGRGLFGARWRSDRSDCAALRAFAEWIVVFRRELLADALTKKAVEVAAMRIDAEAIRASIARLHASADAVRESVRALLADVQVDEEYAFGAPLDELELTSVAIVLEQWHQQTSALFRWAQFNAARASLRATVAAPLEPYLTDDRLSAPQLLPFFRAALAESLLRVAFRERASLGQFTGALHEKRIDRFRELDRGLVAVNRARLSRLLQARRPQLNSGASPASEAGILLGEFNRKRGHMAIRKLLAKAGSLVQRIKPCFLMSPLSIAQFLDPRSARFDLIVFDEASQVRPEDAIGALLRGTQLVVMGDTQQLPPTSFFDHLAADDGANNEDESAALKDVESILHQCARSYPTQTLTWHYRSRHESLIAISNAWFYENKLRIYPSSIDRAEELGLHFVHVPHSTYDRGGSGMNRIEAQVVARATLEHFRRHPEKSLGIGTFNIKQQEAIQEELESQLRAHPELEPFFRSDRREPLFVKNLETIQGDERDVILVSLGFGRDAAGHLSLNFGPINREGGERRLNVLISRAREKCVVYSNFKGGELSLDGTTSRGVAALKAYLEYAETRQLLVFDDLDDEEQTAFEDAVAAVLREHGHDVRQRVGRDAARIDVAVVDPEHPGRYLIGIQCDGRQYHGSRVARDRDRLRRQILETLGWTLHRVWSTDWYRNRAETVARLLDAVAAARTARPEPEALPEVVVMVEETPFVPIVEEAAAYESCTTLRIPTFGELHAVPHSSLALAVEDVVTVEGPVHFDEVVRRIRTIWGLQRAGNRIREAVAHGASIAVSERRVENDGNFLRIPNAAIRVRRRNGDPPPKIDLICDAEIAEAVRHVLRAQFATQRDDLVSATARRLGIQATSGAVAERIEEVIERAVATGLLNASGDVIRL